MAELPPQRPFARIETRLEGLGGWRMPAAAAGSGPLVVCFLSHGYQVGPQRIEFGRLISSSGHPAIFLSEAAKAFYSTPGLADRIGELVLAEMAACGAAETITLGFSQGGFGAIAFAERFPVRLALALAPRWSPDNAVVADPRELDLRGPLPFRTLARGLDAARRAVVLHGMQGPDRRHLRRFPRSRRLEHWLFRAADHEVHNEMRRRDCLAGTILDALSGEVEALVARLRAATAVRAGTPRAWMQLTASSAKLHRLLPFGRLAAGAEPREGA